MKRPVLNRKLVLETPVEMPDGAGGFLKGWTELGTVWAQVEGRTGRERVSGGATVSSSAYRITVRATPYGSLQRPGASQRLRGDGTIFVIRAVVDRGTDGRYLTCFADEEVAA